MVNHGEYEKALVGMPQGGPLSPLLSNVMLNELDKEVEKRGHKFVRYADDSMLFCKSKRSAERTLNSITKFMEKKLFLKVNKEKTKAAHISKVKFPGYGFYRYNGKRRFKVHKKSLSKMKAGLKELTHKNNGWGNDFRKIKLGQFITGRVNYFSLADMKSRLPKSDERLRRRIRAVYRKQRKRVKTGYKMIRKFNLSVT